MKNKLLQEHSYFLSTFNEKTLDEIFDKYSEPHRHYHNLNHIYEMLQHADRCQSVDSRETYLLKVAILFHDVIYDPTSKMNEINSADFMLQHFKSGSADERRIVFDAILKTSDYISFYKNRNDSYVERMLALCDLYDFYFPEKVMKNEKLIFKEYQFVDILTYIKERMRFITELSKFTDFPSLSYLINHLRTYIPNVGIYAGSFNPFHVGHLNILEKAETVFDKVIVAQGTNSLKEPSKFDITNVQSLKYRQVSKYDGLLTDYIQSLGYKVTLVRGVRNITDLQFEMTLYRTLKDLMPELEMVSFFCDSQYEHVSSTNIRELQKYKKLNETNKYLVL